MNPESMIVRCDQCGTKNRIPLVRIKDKPICGKCQAPLPEGLFSDRPVDVTDATFNREVLGATLPTLVDCWAPWCGPCRMVAPILEQLAAAHAGRIRIAKLNVDENPKTASQYGIRSIPTLLLFVNGKLTDKMVGALGKQELERHLAPFL